jgi:hypothetical protein
LELPGAAKIFGWQPFSNCRHSSTLFSRILYRFHNPEPRSERAFPVRMLRLSSFFQMLADDLHDKT